MRYGFWIKEGLRASLVALFSASVYMLVWSASTVGELSWQKAFSQGIQYMTVLWPSIGLFLNLDIGQGSIPLAISFSRTRCEVLWGLQIYRLSLILPLLGITLGAPLLVSAPDAMSYQNSLIFTISAYILSLGIGGFMGTLVAGKSKGIYALILIGGCIVHSLIVSIIHGIGTATADWVLLLLGVGSYILCCAAEKKAYSYLPVR